MLINGLRQQIELYESHPGFYGAVAARNLTQLIDRGEGSLSDFEPVSIRFHCPDPDAPVPVDVYERARQDEYRRNLSGFTVMDADVNHADMRPKPLTNRLRARYTGIANGSRLDGFKRYLLELFKLKIQARRENKPPLTQDQVAWAAAEKLQNFEDTVSDEELKVVLDTHFNKKLGPLKPVLARLALNQPEGKVPFRYLAAMNLVRDGIVEVVEAEKPGFWHSTRGQVILRQATARLNAYKAMNPKAFGEYEGIHTQVGLDGVISQLESFIALEFLNEEGMRSDELAQLIMTVADKARLTDRYSTVSTAMKAVVT
ncbi:MAG: hypothetical protein KC474_10015 [Cyanobacteria bacterium HKST-UBA04]|nr:hypothetical protein [Cyanobacteria bacterium HKST-UBA04]MCA9842028.1 hypothetical protein [Cyanobacteria bacterium HKST-UBA03]